MTSVELLLELLLLTRDPSWLVLTYMSNTGNLTPMDKSTFRWFRWIHRTNLYSVGEVFFRWKINDVMTHGKQISVKLRLSDGSDGSIGQASLL